MKIVLDLQALQTESRFRGIGRYSLALARAMISEGKNHEFIIILNHNFPDTIDWVKKAFDDLLPPENILTFSVPRASFGLDENSQRQYKSCELIREYFIEQLKPDFIHVSSLFEVLDENVVSINCFGQIPTATTLYDLIPYLNQESYLGNTVLKTRYFHQISHLRRSELVLAISEYTRQEAIKTLGLRSEQVVNISSDANSLFQKSGFDKEHIRILKERYSLVRNLVIYTSTFEPRKNFEGLIVAYAALPIEVRAKHQLVICGDLHQNRRLLEQLASRSGLAKDEVVLTGYVADQDLIALYNICKLFVFPSLYEGFGLPVLEAMRCGAAVIGSNSTSIPEVIGVNEALFDPNSIESVSRKIYQALTDEHFHLRLVENGQIQIQKFSWKDSAQRALNAIEIANGRLKNTRSLYNKSTLEKHSPKLLVQHLLNDIALVGYKQKPSDAELLELAKSINENSKLSEQNQLLVDISVLVKVDAKTGIQRVTRSILRILIEKPPAGFRVEPVYRSNGFYRYARQFMASFMEVKDTNLIDFPINVFSNDIFLGLDLDAEVDDTSSSYLLYHSQRGLKIFYIVYDLFPLLRPEWCTSVMNTVFKTWIKHISAIGDGLICISRSTAEDAGNWLNAHPVERVKPLKIDYFHLGADIEASKPTKGLSSKEKGIIEQLSNQTNILMVGTIEPRKGHRQALEAFEQIWNKGNNVNLIIFGKQGWNVKDLIQKLNPHHQKDNHLFWFDQASDELLINIYNKSSALLMASEGEGFGLPLIEAAKHGLPIIARDLPVFREIAGRHAFYFSGTDTRSLASGLEAWLDLFKQNKHPKSQGIKWLTWAESAEQLKKALFNPISRATWDPQHGFQWNSESSSDEDGKKA